MTKMLKVPFECPECDRAYNVELDLVKMTRLNRVAICGRCKTNFSLLVRLTDGRHTIPPIANGSIESSPVAPVNVPVSNPLPEIPDLEIPDIVPVSNPLPDIPDIIAESEAALASEPEPAEPEAASRPMELVVETSSNAKKGKGSKRGGKVKRRRYATDVGIGPKLKLLQEEYGLKVDD